MKTIINTAIIRNWTGGVLFLLLTTFSAGAFTNLTAQATIQASNLGSSDHFGKSVGIAGDTVVGGAYFEDSNATGVNGDGNNNLTPNSGAAYIHVRNGAAWAEQAYLKASNTGTNDNFGWAAGISGDTVVIGSPLEDSNATGVNGNSNNDSAVDSACVYVFVRNGINWTQQAYIKASNTGTGDDFGRTVAISGDTIVIGAVGEASNATGVNGNQTDNSLFGTAGAAYVFVRNGTTWTQQAYLKASTTGSFPFGSSVAISSNTIVVGAIGGESAYVFVRNGTIWSQQALLKASNTEGGDGFGNSVGISSDTIVVGAYGEDSSATGVNGVQTNNLALSAGAAYVFVRSGTKLEPEQAYLKASNAEADDSFGFSVVLAGDNLVVGAIGEASNATGINGNQNNNSLTFAGAAYVFSRTGTNWIQQYYLKSSNPGLGNVFGEALAVSSNTVVVGNHTMPSFGSGGEIYIFAELYVPLSTPPVITSISVGLGFVNLECLGTPDLLYDIERADDNLGNSFNVIDTQIADPSGLIFSTDSSPPVAGAFYRLRQQ